MMTTLQSAPRTPHNGSTLEPGRQLSPSPRNDGSWRLLLTLLGAAVLVLLLLGMGALSVSSWFSARSYAMVPSTTELGNPDSLSLTSDLGDVRVEHSAAVDQVTLALVENGMTELPAADEEARARIDQRGDAGSTQVAVNQPDGPSAIPWEDQHRDLLLLIPADHELTLEIASTVGDVDAEGTFSALTVASEAGDVRLASVTAPGGLTVTSDVGDVEVELEGPTPDAVEVTTSVGNAYLLLPVDASGDVTVRSDMGDIDLTAPGTTQWSITASTELGERSVDPSFASRTGDEVGTLTVTSEVGNVAISR